MYITQYKYIMATSSYTVIWWSKSFAFNIFIKGPWNVFDAAARPIMFLSGIFEYHLGFCFNIFISHSNNMSVFFFFFQFTFVLFFQALPILHQYKLQN